jgi:hypothetical protein
MNWSMVQTPPPFKKSPFHQFGARMKKKAETARAGRPKNQLAADRPPLLVVDADDQQFVGVAPVVDPKRRNSPTPHDSTRAER